MTPEVRTKIEQIRHGNVPGGYKHSAVGVVPADWDVHLISDHLSESYVLGNMGDVAKKITVKLWNRGVCEKKEIHQGSENTQYYRRQKGQFIYSKLDFLNCAFGIIPSELDGYESTQDLPAFDIREINPYYLLAQVTQRRFYERWGIMVANGGRKARRISPDDFLTFPIAFPNRYEQDKIAEILITQDKVIELEQQIIEEIKKVKKFFLSKMFPKKGQAVPEIRFKGFTDAWEQRKVREISDRYDNLRIPVAANLRIPGATPYYGANGIQDYVEGFTHDGEFVLVAEDGANDLKNYPVKCVEGRIWVNNHAHVLQGKPKKTDNPFLAYSINQADIESLLVGGGRAKLNAEVLMDIELSMPSFEEQQKIGSYFAQLDKLITLHQRKLEEEKQKKKALMQLLLMGIVRV